MRSFGATQVVFLLAFLWINGLCESQMGVVVAPMEKGEQEALHLVIQGFVGNWWNGSVLYPDPCGWTPIQGVSCDFFDDFWYITGINIGPVLENSLECDQGAKFTPSLFNLKHLKSISIFDCFTAGHNTTIPSLNWNKLASSLETLELRSNQGLIGEIPVELGQLTNLQSLVLVENSLSGQLQTELANLGHLKRLSLDGNKFSGCIPHSLGYNLSNLLILDLSRNFLSGPVPSSIGSLTSLLKLDLSNNLLNGSIPKALGNMKNLTLLDLSNNNLSGGLCRSLQEMVSLQDLLLSNNPIGGELMEFEFGKLINLTNLGFSNMGLGGMIPESITKLHNLRFIALDNNKLYGSVPPKIESLPCLHALRLDANNLEGELGFSEEFYRRMGMRFASWGNPDLCYIAGVVSKENAPFGLDECSNKEENYMMSSNKKMGEDSGYISSSFGFSDTCSRVNGFAWVILFQELMVVLMLVLLL